MAYEEEMKRADEYMTKQYDSQFATAKVQGLKWDPWVGKNYKDTGILFLGMSTYADKGDEWFEYASNNRDTSRILISYFHDEYKPFKVMSKMFLGGAGREHNEREAKIFWSSVAFNNFVQEVVTSGTQVGEVDITVLRNSRDALHATIKILKLELVLVWGVTTVDVIDNISRRGKEKIN